MLHLFAQVEYQFSDTGSWNPQGALVVVGFLIVLGYVAFSHESLSQFLFRKVKVPSLSSLPTDADAVQQAEQSQPQLPGLTVPKSKREKRRWLRRGGNPVDILLAGPEGTAPVPAQVLDRSRGGLLIAVSQPMSKGAILKVRACHAPDELEWIAVEVRHCRQKGEEDLWLLGCAFRCELPWSILLLFG